MEEGRWLGVRIRLASSPGASGADPIDVRRAAAVLLAEGASAVHEEDEGGLVAHVPAPGAPEAFLRRLRGRIEAAVGRPPEAVERWWQEERDWAEEWRRTLEPRRVGESLVVAPPGQDVEVGEGDHVLRIEPGMAFGSGEHGSTRGVLRLLEASLRRGDAVLDAGTGSGVLAVAAVLLGADRVVAVDTDPEVLPVARENLERNGIEGAVRLVEATVDTTFLTLLSPLRFDLVLANLSARALRPLLDGLRPRVSREGALIVGGILLEESDGFRAAVRAAGWRVDEEERDEGWWSARLVVRRRGGSGVARPRAPARGGG